MSAGIVDAFVAQLQREAARSGAVGGGGAALTTTPPPPGPATSPAALPASKWAARSWEELPDNFAGAALATKDQQWPRAPSSSQQQPAGGGGAPPGSPLAARGGGAPPPCSPHQLVAAAMTPGGPALAAAAMAASPQPQTAFKQRTNAGQVVSGLNAGGGGGKGKGKGGGGDAAEEDDGGLPELAAAAAASRQRYQRMLRESKQQQQKQQGDAQEGDIEERTAAASAVVLSAPPSSASSSSSDALLLASSSVSLLLPARGHRYMMERIEDKVAAVDGRITAFERALRAALRTAGRAELAGAELAAVGAPYLDDGEADGGGLFVGRVVSDAAGAAAGGQAAAAPPPLNATSLLLEGGVASSDGARARLVLTPAATSGPAAVRLFPGQVVGVRGFSPEGHTIFARQVYTHVPPPPPRRRAGAAGGGAAGAGAAVGEAGGAAAAAAAAGEETTAAAAAAPMDLDAMVAAAGPGGVGGEQKEQEQQQAAAKQQQQEAAAAAAAAAEQQQQRRAAAKQALRTLPPSLSIVAAAGPFTCSDDLAYDPLTALLESLRPSPPDLLLLLGPFVDAEHPRVADGLCPCPLDALLSQGVAARLASWRASLPQPHRTAMRVALVPSVRDAPAHPTFPQPPLDLPGAAPLPAAGGGASARPRALPDAPLALQNPCAFVVSPPPAADADGSSTGANQQQQQQGLLIAATSQDVLRHLAGSELALGGGAGAGGAGAVDRLTALASHLLGQRHLYPLFPAHASACLDTSGDALLRLRARPDLLLLPSDLAPFARRVPPVGPSGGGGVAAAAAASSVEGDDDVLCVNPGRLAKGAGGGTYARIVVVGVGGAGASSDEQQQAAAALPLADRARVEIVRV
jgi:hypothetical protein